MAIDARLWHAGRSRDRRGQEARRCGTVVRAAERGRGSLSDEARMGAAAGRRAVAAQQARADAEQGREGRAGAVHGAILGTIFSAMTYLIAIDQGTTSTRAIVFDAGLAPVA